MVVEDDPDERTMVAEVLEELGFAVEQAPDAGVALALLDEGADVELLVSDQAMPGMSGVELARVVGERHPSVRTLLLTAFSDEDLCRRAVEASAVTVLTKPLRVIDLERALEEV
jgi:CheY-like chemotaxis protein